MSKLNEIPELECMPELTEMSNDEFGEFLLVHLYSLRQVTGEYLRRIKGLEGSDQDVFTVTLAAGDEKLGTFFLEFLAFPPGKIEPNLEMVKMIIDNRPLLAKTFHLIDQAREEAKGATKQ